MIELRGLRKEYAGIVALQDIDLSVPAGQIHGIVGRSGAGKSTLIRCLTGLAKPTSGTVSIDGVDVTGHKGEALRKSRRTIGMVFQHANLLDSRTALGNVEHPLAIAKVGKKERRERALELLEIVGLTDRAQNYPAQLSGGQQQRVGIARALAADPKILLCDEPTSALDSRTTRQILELIRSLSKRLGITVLIITHEMSVVREACDSVTLLADGRVQQSGTLNEVLTDPSSDLAKDLVPLPTGVVDEDSTALEIALTGTSVADVFALAERADASITSIEAGTLATINGTQVGRLRLLVASPAERTRLAEALRASDIYVDGGAS